MIQALRGILLAAAMLVFLVAVPASGMELQLGAASTQVGQSESHGSTSTIMPFLALGGNLGSNLLAFVEAGKLDYAVSTENRPNGQLLPGNLNVMGSSLALIVVPRFERFDLRIGYGTISYTYTVRPSQQTNDLLAALGFSDVNERLLPTSGTQLIGGLDFFLTSWLTFGVEVRSVTVKPILKDNYTFLGVPYAFEGTIDLSHSMTNFRLMIRI